LPISPELLPPWLLDIGYLADDVLQLLIPNGAYNGQKLTLLVNKKIAAIAKNTYPKVPVTVPVK